MNIGEEMIPAQTRTVERLEHDSGRRELQMDTLVVEEPLEIRIARFPIAVVMRTPGHDEDLAWGFLTTERIIERPEQIQSVRHCLDAGEGEQNVIIATPGPGFCADVRLFQRNFFVSSSCGICGKASIDRVMATAPALPAALRVSAGIVRTLPDGLRREQRVFDATGGLHAAGLFDESGRCWAVREDVGRHNAVDKVIGWCVRQPTPLPLSDSILVVSGRISFEIVQKALAARISVVVGVSAASSLAVELANRAGVTLLGFARGDRFCVYTGQLADG